jgi:transcriptional regulator with XRE-family HTH domain
MGTFMHMKAGIGDRIVEFEGAFSDSDRSKLHIGEIIRVMREDRRISRAALSAASSVSEATISRIERSPEYDGSFRSIVSIFLALGVSVTIHQGISFRADIDGTFNYRNL